MIFNSLEYALFLPTVLALHWALRPRWRTPLLVVASYVFYGAWDVRFLSLLLISTVVDYSVGRYLERTDDPRHRRLALLVSLATNLTILGFFKYAGFFVESAQDLLTRAGFEPGQASLQFILPVGISFYTFQTMSYTIDVYRHRMPAERSLVTFALFVAYFPQLVAGPIERATRLVPQLRRTDRPAPTAEQVGSGVTLIALGLFKKVVLADQVAPYVEDVFSGPGEAGSLAISLAVVGFAVQIYGDFSGYTDIARGSSRLLSVELMHNFRQPYLSRTITEFWRRWHVSLSEWLRDYLYIPLGGNRGTPSRTYRNLMITMVLGGLWHGAAWTFVAWGALHGVYLAVHRAYRPVARRTEDRMRPADLPAVLGTFALVCIAWVFFRATSFENALDVFGGLMAFRGPAPSFSLTAAVLTCGAAMLALDLAQRMVAEPTALLGRRPEVAGTLLGFVLIGLIVFSGTPAVPFIYFQF